MFKQIFVFCYFWMLACLSEHLTGLLGLLANVNAQFLWNEICGQCNKFELFAIHKSSTSQISRSIRNVYVGYVDNDDPGTTGISDTPNALNGDASVTAEEDRKKKI